MCGAVSGPTMNLDLALDVAFAVKTLIDPSLKLTGYSSAQDANTNWTHAADALKTAAADTAHGGTAKVLFIAALVGASNRTQTYDGADIVSQVKGTVESLLTALAYGTAGRYEIEQRVGGNPSDNSKADYWARISSDTALLLAELGGDPGGYAKQLAAAPRVTADAAARQKFVGLGDPSGRIVVPTVTMHTEADPLVLVQNEGVLAQRARVAGRSGELSQLFIAPPAKYSETTGAPYGAGHCNFNDRQRLALVQTLDSWVRHDTYPVQAGLVGRFGAGYDPNFAPGPWPTTPAV